MLRRNVPVKKLDLKDGETLVATVHDLLVAHYGVDRGFGGLAAKSFDDDTPYTPAWAEKITGVPRDQIIATARDFASNAEKTHGKSMVILGAGLNHWYHMDMTYRGIINLLVFCGCVGQSGGGWSHYVGQEKLRPQTGWTPLAFALDWHRPPRHMNGTSFWYAHFRPVALREAGDRRDRARRPATSRSRGRSSTSTSAPSAWAGCPRRRSSRPTRSRSAVRSRARPRP